MVGGEKCKESKVATVMTSLRGGEKRKQLKKKITDTVSTEEIEVAMQGGSPLKVRNKVLTRGDLVWLD